MGSIGSAIQLEATIDRVGFGWLEQRAFRCLSGFLNCLPQWHRPTFEEVALAADPIVAAHSAAR